MRWAAPVLWLAAAYNLVIAAGSLVDPAASVEGRLVGLLVGCFGLLYAMVARDVARLRPVLWTGVIGKLGVIALMAPLVASGAQPALVGALLAGDALFTLAFLAILLRPLPSPP